MATRKPTDRRRGGLDGELPEPDLAPMMNLTFMLILALLTMASLMPLGLISVQAPQIGGGGGGATNTPNAKKLDLTILVTRGGYNIAAEGATLDGSSAGRKGEALFPKIDGKGGGKAYDTEALNKRLIQIKKTFPREQSVIITADEEVTYEDIVKTMDAARESPDGEELFPAVAFSAGIMG